MVVSTAPTASAVPVLSPKRKLKLMEPLLKASRDENQISALKNQITPARTVAYNCYDHLGGYDPHALEHWHLRLKEGEKQ
jgi:hypothetical protein